jgi:oxaloacetate decarboxylase gamma subunit
LSRILIIVSLFQIFLNGPFQSLAVRQNHDFGEVLVSHIILYAEVYFMTILEMIEQSMILTVLGMAVVFAFLWIMIICVNVTGGMIHKMGLDKDVEQPPVRSPAAGAGTPLQVTAAIIAGVKEYQENEK